MRWTTVSRLRSGVPRPASSETGTLELGAFHEGGNIIIEVRDDGAGLNKAKILQKARERGLVGPDQELTDEQIDNLIFMPGFSTAEQVSDVSGRGVGMDVVRRNINDLGGHVQISSKEGQGSTIRIRLPLTLAILDGQLVRVGKEIYIISLLAIVETIQASKDRINTLGGPHRGISTCGTNICPSSSFAISSASSPTAGAPRTACWSSSKRTANAPVCWWMIFSRSSRWSSRAWSPISKPWRELRARPSWATARWR